MTHSQQSVLYSIIFHGLVILCMFSIKFQMESSHRREYIEIIAMDIEPVQPLTRVVTTPAADASAQVTTQESQPQTTPALSALPQNINTPTVSTPDVSTFDISNLPTRGERVINTPLGHETRIDPSMGIAHTTTPGNTGTSAATTNRPGLNVDGLGDEIRANLRGSSDYQMEGDVNSRIPINSPLPTFPEHVQETGTVTISFTIAASGIVQNLNVTRRSIPEFESAALTALRQWVFDTSDRSHSGQISFNFILR
jgi:TonB family protein